MEGCQTLRGIPTMGLGYYQSRMPPIRKTSSSLRMRELLSLGTDGDWSLSPERVMRKW